MISACVQSTQIGIASFYDEGSMKRKLRSYFREELRDAIEQGARCVKFQYCLSLLYTFHGESDVVVVHGRLDGIRASFWYTLGTAVLGWWGPYGVISTPVFLVVNLFGGNNVTIEVLATLQSDA